MEANGGRPEDGWRIVRVEFGREAGLVDLLLARSDADGTESSVIQLVQTSSETEALLAHLCVALRSIAQAHAGEERAQRVLERESRIAAAAWAQQALAAAGSMNDVGVLVGDRIDQGALFVSLYTGGAGRLFFHLRYDEALAWISVLSDGLAGLEVDGAAG